MPGEKKMQIHLVSQTGLSTLGVCLGCHEKVKQQMSNH